MRLHPFHPISVHAPIACIVFAPLADLVALTLHRSEFWLLGASMTAGAALFGFVAASFGALDFERAHAKAPRAVSWHAVLMTSAVTLDGASAFGRIGHAFMLQNPPPAWALVLSALGLALAGVGGVLGGELVYRHGVGVQSAR